MVARVKIATKPEAPAQKSGGKETPGKRGAASARSRRVDKSRTKGKKTRHKLKLKGWLATPADWARFEAWVKIRGQPKTIPDPPPVVRPSKSLPQLMKRIKPLSQPKKTIDPKVHCKLGFTVSRAALRATPSTRTILLSLPNLRLVDYGRVYYKVSPAALRHEASPRLLQLSQPKGVLLPEECKPPCLTRCESRGVDKERLRKLALAKKLIHCPEELTPEEMAEIFTPQGIKRTALKYEITPWMTFLSLPSYKRIRERKDEDAITWKKTIIEEGERRGKAALEEYRSGEGARRGKKRKFQEEEEKEEEEKVDEKAAKKRRAEKHAWRFAPLPEKKDPHGVKKAALEIEASPRTQELAKSLDRKDKVTRTNAFTVRKGALAASPSERTASLAKPKMPLDPVEKKPPREKNKYGKPIFEMPVHERVLPEPKPYKMGKCPPPPEKVVKKRPIDPIAYEGTYDPCIHPWFAKKQKLERKRAEKLCPEEGKKKRKRRARAKKSDFGATADEGRGPDEDGSAEDDEE